MNKGTEQAWWPCLMFRERKGDDDDDDKVGPFSRENERGVSKTV